MSAVETERAVDQYVAQISRYRVLSREEEVKLAEHYRRTGEMASAHALICANLRFVVKVAHEYRGYRLRILDLIQEGNLGLIMATKKFEPERGYRLISYAVWWIRAYMQAYIIRHWSLVKVGTTQAQRKLFFRLRSARTEADRDAGPHEVVSAAELAEALGVAEAEVISMEMRLAARDFSLDAPIDDGARQNHLDGLISDATLQEDRLGEMQERLLVRREVGRVLPKLNPKEAYIVRHRLLSEEPETLQQIGERFQISRERARQIEGNVLRKIRTRLDHARLRAA